MSHGKMADFVSFPLFGSTLVIKLRNFDFQNHWNIFDIHKVITSNLNMPDKKMSDYVSFPLFVFTLAIKLGNFDSESHWNTLIFLNKKNDARFHYLLSVSDLV